MLDLPEGQPILEGHHHILAREEERKANWRWRRGDFNAQRCSPSPRKPQCSVAPQGQGSSSLAVLRIKGMRPGPRQEGTTAGRGGISSQLDRS